MKGKIAPAYDMPNTADHSIRTPNSRPRHLTDINFANQYKGLATRNLTIQSSIRSKAILHTISRVKFKLRGVLTFSRFLRDLTMYGSSAIFIASKMMNKNINSVLAARRMIMSASTKREVAEAKLLLHPDSTFLQIWNLLMLILLVYVFIGTPWILAFEDIEIFSTLFFIELAVDFLSLIHI